MAQIFENEYCKIAAQMLHSEPGLLDYQLVDYLNSIAILVERAGGKFVSRQAIATAIIAWQTDQKANSSCNPSGGRLGGLIK